MLLSLLTGKKCLCMTSGAAENTIYSDKKGDFYTHTHTHTHTYTVHIYVYIYTYNRVSQTFLSAEPL